MSSHEADRILASGAAAGDPEMLELFVQRLSCVPAIVSAINARMGTPLQNEDVNDVAQIALIHLWRKSAAYAGLASLETWAYHFCCLELMNALRRRRSADRLRVPLEPVENAIESRCGPAFFEHESLHRGLEELDRSQAAVIRLKFFEELTFDEIAQRLALPANTAKTHLYRGLRRLREILVRRDKVGFES